MAEKPGGDDNRIKVWIAVLGLIGVLGGALIGILPQIVPPAPTQTAAPVLSTSTATPVPTTTWTGTPSPTALPGVTQTPTDTPTPSSTPVLFLAPGQDWLSNCISGLWIPYPNKGFTLDERNCWQPPVHGFAATGAVLSLRASESVRTANLYGLLLPIQQDTSVSVGIALLQDFVQSKLWIGIVDGDDFEAGIIMIYSSDGDRIRQIEPGYSYLFGNDESVALSDRYHLVIELDQNEISIPINAGYTFSTAISYRDPHLFIGYLLLPGTGRPNLNVRLSDLQIMP